MKLTVIILIFVILMLFDKGLTIGNIIQANKNFPEAMQDDPYKVEKNPIAKWFFERDGLILGTVFFGILTLLFMFFAFLLLSIPFGNSVALYIMVMLYGLVIANNFYFLFKYSGLIP